jgi:hypothetical protein
MKIYYLLFAFCLLIFNDAKSQKALLGELTPEIGVVENEAYIKFTFQKHLTSSKSDYNITYFETAFAVQTDKNLEFWGHGRNTLSLLGPVQLNLEKEQITVFTEKIKNHYIDFQKNIRSKLKSFEHSDIIVFENMDIIFSCYMNNKTAEYAFWIDKKKYKLDERALGVLLLRLENYYE